MKGSSRCQKSRHLVSYPDRGGVPAKVHYRVFYEDLGLVVSKTHSKIASFKKDTRKTQCFRSVNVKNT